MHHSLLAASYRNNLLEAEHHGSLVVCDSDGNIIAKIGSGEYKTFIRSSMKMVQAIPVVESGAASKYSFTDSELSICCASHAGSDFHINTVAQMLDKMGLSEHHLQCGSHKPENEQELKKLYSTNTNFNQLYNNCSGKHSGMLATCLANGWDLGSYLRIEHNLQQEIIRLVANYIQRPASSIKTGIDGCSLPTVYLSLTEMATMLAKYTKEATNPNTAQHTIFNAVCQKPEMINDTNGFDTLLVKNCNARLIAKRGAMAVFVIGMNTVQYGQIGIAVKLISGDSVAMPPVIMRVLEQLELLSNEEIISLEKFRTIEQNNWNNIFTGKICSDFELSASSVF